MWFNLVVSGLFGAGGAWLLYMADRASKGELSDFWQVFYSRKVLVCLVILLLVLLSVYIRINYQLGAMAIAGCIGGIIIPVLSRFVTRHLLS